MNLKRFMTHYRFFIILALYFIILTAIKMFGSLEYDDAEQAFLAKELHFGYNNAQPPLYNYLQFIFFKIFGYGKFAIFLLKHIILFLIYISIYLFALDISKSYKKALTASILTLLLPQILWQSEVMLNHSVLAAWFGVLFLWLFFKLTQKPLNRYFFILGLIGGAGFLSKYSFIILIATFFIYALLKRYKFSSILIFLFGFLIISSFHLVWIFQHLEFIISATAQKTLPNKSILDSILSLIGSTALFLGPLLVAAYLLKREFKIYKEFLIFYAILFTVLFVMALIGVNYKPRWMLPFLTPVVAILLVDYSKKLEIFGYILMGLMVVFYILKIFYPDITRPTNSNLPIKELEKELPKGDIITNNTVLKGNFALYRKKESSKLFISKKPKKDYKIICKNYLFSKKEFCIYYKESR